MRSIRFALALIILNFLFQAGYAQSWLWATEPVFEGSQSSDGEGISLATDPEGNVYETGYFSFSTMHFGSTIMTANNADFYLVKYDTGGNVLWAKQGTVRNVTYGQSQAYSVSSDPWGNAYVTGFFSDTLVLGSYTLTTGLKYSIEIFVAKYDPNGNVLWARQSKANAWTGYPNWAMGSVTDKEGSVYITGEFNDTTTFGGFSLGCPVNYAGDVFLVKYDSGGQVIWARQGNIPSAQSHSVGNAVTIDAQGNLYITGGFRDSLSIGSTQLVNRYITGDIFVAKYDPNGNPLWCRQSINNSQNNYNFSVVGGNSVATDRSGNVYVAGNFDDTISFGADTLMNGVTTTEAAPYGDMFVVKYDGNGNVVWAKQAQPITRASYNGYGIAADTLGHLYFTGTGINDSSQNNKLNFSIKFGADTFTITGSGTPSIECSMLIQLDDAGNVLCGAAIPLGGDDWSAIAVDPSGRYVYMGSDYLIQYSNVTIGPSTLNSNNNMTNIGEEIPFVARWSPCNPALPLSVGVNKTDATCYGLCNGAATANPTGGTSPYHYVWNTNLVDTTQTVTGLCEGGYTVTITDHSGNTVTTAFTIGQPAAITSAITAVSDTLCAGDTARLSATGNTANIVWQSAVTGSGFTDITGANDSIYANAVSQTTQYRVLAGNGGCHDTSTAVTLIVNPLPLPAVATADSLICFGDSVQVCTTDTFAFYLWNTGATSFCATAEAAGGYWVTVTDANHCSAVSGHQEISVYPVPSVSIIEQGDTLSSYGQVSYQWLLNGNPISNATGSFYVANAGGDYSVEVTDSDGCTAISNAVAITGMENLNGSGGVHPYPNPFLNTIYVAATDVAARMEEVEIYDMMGRIVFSKKLSSVVTGQLTIDASTLAEGIYYIKIMAGAKEYTQKIVKI